MQTTQIISLPYDPLVLPGHCDDRCVRRTPCKTPATLHQRTAPGARQASRNLVLLFGTNSIYDWFLLEKKGRKENSREGKKISQY